MLGRYGKTADSRFSAAGLEGHGVPGFWETSDFSFGYAPINGRYPAGSPGTYAVGANDTLKGIAKGAYGDASLWYLIADANGLASNADLRAGQVLTIPSAVPSGNNAESFRPYDPSRIQNGSPTMMAMPQDQGGCGAAGQVIVVVVAVIATIYTTGALSGVAGPLGSTMSAGLGVVTGGAAGGAVGAAAAAGLGTVGTIGVAATAAAVGSAVSQGVGIAIGAQEDFSWKQVALSAASAGVTAGIGGSMPLGSAAGETANAVARAAIGNAMTQGIAVVTGLQDQFDWRGVAAAAAGSAVGQATAHAVGPALSYSDFGRFATRAVSSVAAGVTVAAMRGGRVNATQVAVDAFGNAVGSSIAEAAGQIGVPSPVSAEERAGILGMFADGPGDDALRFNGRTFSEDMALRQAASNAYGLSRGSSGHDRWLLPASRVPFFTTRTNRQITSGSFSMKRTFLKLAAIGACTVVFAGCASGIKQRDMADSMPSLKSGEGRVYFFRSSSLMGAAIQPDIRLNGQVVGTSKPGGFFYVDRPAGNYVASTSTETEKTASFVLGAGETKYVRTSPSFGVVVGRIVVELESAEKANAELPSLSYTGTVASN